MPDSSEDQDQIPPSAIERLANRPASIKAYTALVEFRGQPMTVAQIADMAGISKEAWYSGVGELLLELGLVKEGEQMGNAQTYTVVAGDAYDGFTEFRAGLQYGVNGKPGKRS